MDEASIPTRKVEKPSVHRLKLFAPAIILFFALLGFQVWRAYDGSQPQLQANGVPLSPEIEERFGIRLLGVHLLARHGLVDLRYRVVEAGKAKNFGHYTETSPLLIAEDSGDLVEVTIMGLHNHRVETGRVYYVLYRNTGDALEPGSRVTVQIGDLSLQHVPVQ